tara:strand:- start:3069 stop:4223 length:1155 start_codon:yes stop_codon:yes gene_type:complete
VVDYSNIISELRKDGYYRERMPVDSPQDRYIVIKNKKVLNFSSNDYLGLANSNYLKDVFYEKVKKYGVGSGSSPLISGYSSQHKELEQELTKLTKLDSTVVMNSGYLANVGLINALSDKDVVILQDKMNHNSIIEGTRLTKSQLIRFHHKNYSDLSEKIKKVKCGLKIIYVDAVFSMTGEFSDLKKLSSIARENNAFLFVDDAHGFGVLENNSKNFPSSLSMYDKDDINIDAYIGTFGKAVGIFGSFISGNKDIIELVIQKSKPYIYSTALPASLAGTVLESLRYIKNNASLNKKLSKNIKIFREIAKKENIKLQESETPIQTIIIGEPRKLRKIQESALKAGIFIQAIRYPTVPKNNDLIRISLTSSHSTKDIERLLYFLKTI